MKIKLLIFSLMLSVVGWGQIGIPNTTPVTQNFDAMAAGATAALPANWKMSVAGAAAPTWGAGGNFTAVSVQASSGSPATGGRYNWGNAAATDRSLGVLTSGGYASPNSIMAYYRNTAATNLTQLSVSYNLERYKVNTAAASVQFFYSLDGTAWTAVPAGDVAATSLPTGAVAYGFPGLTINVGAFNITGLNIASNSDIYLRWNLNTTGANSQGIGIDDVSVTGTFACAPPSTQASVISTNTITQAGCNVAWTAGNGNGTMIVVRPTSSANTLPSSGTAYAPSLAWGSAGTIDANNRVVFRAAGTSAGPITGLTPGTQYTVTAYEYNTVADCYNLTSPVSTTFYTLSLEPTAHAASFSCSVVSSTQIDFTFPAPNTITNGRAYMILQKIGSAPTGVPTDGAYHAAGTVFGDATVAGNTSITGTDTTLSVTGLTPGTDYYFTLIPWDSFLSVPQTINYYTGGTIPSTNCTTSAATVAITSSLTSSSVYGSTYSYSITASGSPTSYNAVGLPAGLTIDTVAGIISGTPTVGVGTYNIDISATNGTTDTKTLVLTITAKNLTITGLTADNKVYDRTLTATLSGTSALVGIVGSDDVTISGTPSAVFATAVVGTAKPVTVTGYALAGAQAGNYTITQPTGLSANITAKQLTVLGAVVNNKVYNGTTAATITGATLVGVIAPDVVNITPSGTFATANAGTAIVVTSTSSISGADSSNYSLTQPTGLAADITQASQTITFGVLANQYTGAANFNLTATASSGLTVTYVSSNPAVATVSGNTVTIVGIGTTVITASQAGDGNYTAAVDVNQNQVVTNAPCLNNSFTSATFPPVGWLATTVTRSTTAADYVTGPAAAIFASNNGSLTTSAVTNPTQLRFYLGRSANATAKTLTVEISTTSQATGFSTIATYDHSNVSASSYNQYTVDLSAYTIYPNVWIRFVKTSATTSPWRFDDLEVFCGTVWDGSAWSNGTPTLASVAVINGDYNTTTNGGDIHASSLTVNPTFTVTVTPNHYVTIENNLTVNGFVNIQNNGSLVQINDSGINTGNINMERTTSVDRYDYVYWSTPVTPFVSSNISPTTNNTIYKWLPTTGGVNGFGNWVNGNETMEVGRGYIERGLNNSPLGLDVNFTATFTGVPNNGVKTMAISRGNYDLVADYDTAVSPTYATKDDDNWNLVGNPYPSSISAEQFLQDNADIAGFVKIWRHGIAPLQSAPDPFYNNYGYNYDSNDYLTYNKTGASAGSVTDYFIGAGQGFFVLMNHSAATPSTVVFNNNMRKETYRNDMFYRATNNSQNRNNEKGRIWLDISSSSASVRTLVGYIDGATNEKERGYDAITDLKANMNIYSLIGFEGQIIQGRQLPFNENDQVPLGIKVSQNGNYTIAIAEVDGFFTNAGQNIYLEDKVSNAIHDLRSSPYSFTANTGIYNNRFVLRYTSQTLGNDDFAAIENGVKIYASNNGININSELENIKHYEIYNVLGQTLATKTNVNKNESIESSVLKNNQTLIVKVTLENGQTVTKKIIF